MKSIEDADRVRKRENTLGWAVSMVAGFHKRVERLGDTGLLSRWCHFRFKNEAKCKLQV
jgi:hypothetical protein